MWTFIDSGLTIKKKNKDNSGHFGNPKRWPMFKASHRNFIRLPSRPIQSPSFPLAFISCLFKFIQIKDRETINGISKASAQCLCLAWGRSISLNSGETMWQIMLAILYFPSLWVSICSLQMWTEPFLCFASKEVQISLSHSVLYQTEQKCTVNSPSSQQWCHTWCFLCSCGLQKSVKVLLRWSYDNMYVTRTTRMWTMLCWDSWGQESNNSERSTIMIRMWENRQMECFHAESDWGPLINTFAIFQLCS